MSLEVAHRDDLAEGVYRPGKLHAPGCRHASLPGDPWSAFPARCAAGNRGLPEAEGAAGQAQERADRQERGATRLPPPAAHQRSVLGGRRATASCSSRWPRPRM